MTRETFKVVDGVVDGMRAQAGDAAEALSEHAEYARDRATDYARKAADSLGEQASHASVRAADYARKAADVLAEQAGYASARAAEYARKAADSVEDWGQEGLETFRGAVKDKPVQWAAISIAAGAVLGGLIAMWIRSETHAAPRRVRKAAAVARKRIPARHAKK